MSIKDVLENLGTLDKTSIIKAINEVKSEVAEKATVSLATTSANGLMSAEDKTKLNGITANANNYSHPATHAASMITGLSKVATSGSYADLSNRPTLGTVASKNTGTASGTIPIIGSDGKLDTTILPALAITDTFPVASQTAMLALTAQVGDVAVRTDISKSFILKTAPASTLANWQELLSPASPVQSVAGKTGAVTLAKGDVGLGSVDNTSDVNKPVSTATQTALNAKANASDLTSHTGNTTVHITAAERTAWNAKASTSIATTSTNGLLSKEDKAKLDGISAGAGNYVLPTATSSVLGGVKTGANIANSSGTISVADGTTSAKGVVQLSSATNSTSTALAATASAVKSAYDLAASKAGTAVATTSANGLMSSTDKSKLDGIASGAQVNTVTSVAGKTGAVTLGKGDVGLGNLDNTSDANKPVSTATQNALNLKANIASAVKRTVLTGKLQATSYRRSVIALCSVDNTNTALDSYTAGTVTFHRSNGLNGVVSHQFNIEKLYNTSKVNYSGLTLGLPPAGVIRPCTFTYNSKLYGGIELFLESAEFQNIEVQSVGNFEIFALDYYNTQTPAAINTEINGSIKFDTVVYHNGFKYNGTSISLSNHTHADATTSASGLMSASDKTKLNGIATGASNYVLPTATGSVLGGVKTGTNIANSSGTISVANGTTSAKGVVQLTDGVASTSTTTAATPNAVKTVNDALTTHKSDTTAHVTASERTAWNAKASTAVATTSANGLMASTDKSKLDGIATNANNYSLPAATTSVRGGVITSTNINNSSGTISVNNASTTVKGVVQLTDGVASTSTTTAATPAAVKTAYDTAASKYTKPSTGIPLTDLNSSVQGTINNAFVNGGMSSAVSDLNNYTKSGTYYFSNSTAHTNSPPSANKWFMLEVYCPQSAFVVQKVTDVAGTHAWQRTHQGSTGWNAWKMVYNESSVTVGTANVGTLVAGAIYMKY